MSDLAAIRKHHNIRQEYLAEQLGVSQKAVSRAENGMNKKVESLIIQWWIDNYGYTEEYFSENPMVKVMAELKKVRDMAQEILEKLKEQDNQEI